MKKDFDDYFSNITMPEEIKQKIFEKTIYKKEKNNFFIKKIVITTSLILTIGLFSFSIVFADEIKTTIKKYLYSTEEIILDTEIMTNPHAAKLIVKDVKSINFKADIDETQYDTNSEKTISISELEKKLEIKFLNSTIQKNKAVVLNQVKKVDGNISHFKGFIRDAFETNSESSSIIVEYEFITKYSKRNKNGYMLLLGINQDIEEYTTTKKLKNLNVDVYIMTTKKYVNDDTIANQVFAAFVYDGISYMFSGTNMSINTMLNVLETLQ